MLDKLTKKYYSHIYFGNVSKNAVSYGLRQKLSGYTYTYCEPARKIRINCFIILWRARGKEFPQKINLPADRILRQPGK